MGKNVYLAGPDVFLPNAVEIGQRKKEILARYGLAGHFPLDNALSPEQGASKRDFGLKIAVANEELMDKCEIIIANMTPWRGVEMDDGTAFEMGYMRAQGKLICGYSQTPIPFAQRVIDECYQGNITSDMRGSDGFAIEDFDLADNLMLLGAIEKSGGLFMASDKPLTKTLPNGEKIYDFDDLTIFEALAKAIA